MSLITLILIGYIIGSFPTAILTGKTFKGIDIREHGSGNAGATNVYRVLGLKPALLVVTIDILKGWLATTYLPVLIELTPNIDLDIGITHILAGLSATIGHTFSIFTKFKGGKGVATIAGMIIALYPIAVLFCLFVFIVMLIIWGYVSLASIAASLILPIIVHFYSIFGLLPPLTSLKFFSLIIPLFVLYTHRSNIRRLLDGTENRFEKVMIFRKSR
ncbi:MAG: glycerol-3-phosphate 1-O-acyltransferase PlsY [Candidatus Marinimicrobia bacterium]|nr:glycerol-3-phosphate 1-O-acyltransferase PlsY [Candidatus Neomarinimicrobiota bacterium]